MRLETIYTNIQKHAATAVIVPSAKRGIPRRELFLSAPRLQALLEGHNLEPSLERSLVSLMTSEESAVWFNQLNVAGGVGGGNGFNRVAVDLGRFTLRGQKIGVSFKELKSWASKDTPRTAVEQVFSYFSWFSALQQLSVAPYEQELWKLDWIQLYLIAPENYFLWHGGVASVCDILRQAEAELAVLRSTHSELERVSFAAMPIVLSRRIGVRTFISCFDQERLKQLIGAESTAASALDVLRPESLPVLREWLHHALVQAGVVKLTINAVNIYKRGKLCPE